MGLKVDFQNNGKAFLNAIPPAKQRALERCGEKGEGYASDLAPKRTGWLSQHITHQVEGDTVEIGTNVEYAAYVELGTGIYYPGGRQTPWCYQDAKGNWWYTHGQPAQPYLKPAVADHGDTYRNIIKDEFEKS